MLAFVEAPAFVEVGAAIVRRETEVPEGTFEFEEFAAAIVIMSV